MNNIQILADELSTGLCETADDFVYLLPVRPGRLPEGDIGGVELSDCLTARGDLRDLQHKLTHRVSE